jgi:hypothetical protein
MRLPPTLPLLRPRRHCLRRSRRFRRFHRCSPFSLLPPRHQCRAVYQGRRRFAGVPGFHHVVGRVVAIGGATAGRSAV